MGNAAFAAGFKAGPREGWGPLSPAVLKGWQPKQRSQPLAQPKSCWKGRSPAADAVGARDKERGPEGAAAEHRAGTQSRQEPPWPGAPLAARPAALGAPRGMSNPASAAKTRIKTFGKTRFLLRRKSCHFGKC